MTRDLTVGKPLRNIVIFTIPILIGNIFQQLYSMVDAIIVGQTINNDALAGVGATGAISFLVIGFVQGLTAGFAVKTSQLFGAGDEEGVRRSIASSLLLSVVLTVILTAVSVVTTMPLLDLMNTPDDIIDYSYDYIVTIYWGLGATVFYNLGSSVLRAIGDSRTPLVFLVLAAVLNVGLDFLFIVYFRMGVAGAGWATVLSQAISAIGCFVFLFARFRSYRIGKKHFANPFKFYWQHMAIGLPMALQFSITSIGMMVQQSALNKLGTAAVTAYTAASKIDNLATQSLYALGSTVATYCGQNYGAGKFANIRVGVRWSMIIGVVCALLGLGFVTIGAEPMTRLFSSDVTDEMMDMSKQYLLWQGVFYIALAAIFVYRDALQGIGRSALTMIGGGIEPGGQSHSFVGIRRAVRIRGHMRVQSDRMGVRGRLPYNFVYSDTSPYIRKAQGIGTGRGRKDAPFRRLRAKSRSFQRLFFRSGFRRGKNALTGVTIYARHIGCLFARYGV